jgi:hypothetical protein
MAITKLQPGYRVRAEIFIPYDPTDTKSVRAAVDHIDRLKDLAAGEGAPKDTSLEQFSFQVGRKDTAD